MSKRISEVVGIGAGVAGLACAQALCEAGLRVTILEARGRVGGRIWTVHPSLTNAPVELGAEFIHGLPREVWQIVERAGLVTHELTGNRWRLEQGRLAPMNLHRINHSRISWNRLVAIYLSTRGSRLPHMSRASTHVTQAGSALMHWRDGIGVTGKSKDTAASVSPMDTRVWFERLSPPASPSSHGAAEHRRYQDSLESRHGGGDGPIARAAGQYSCRRCRYHFASRCSAGTAWKWRRSLLSARADRKGRSTQTVGDGRRDPARPVFPPLFLDRPQGGGHRPCRT